MMMKWKIFRALKIGTVSVHREPGGTFQNSRIAHLALLVRSRRIGLQINTVKRNKPNNKRNAEKIELLIYQKVFGTCLLMERA